MRFSLGLVLVLLVGVSKSLLAGGPLQVYILAGQSNMEGHAKIETFDYIGDDPQTKPLLDKMMVEGRPKVCDSVWISYLTGRGENNGEGFGRLTAGYGSRPTPDESGGKIGPEFTFGITLEEKIDEPILIIKTAWGGKSLFYDFRSPSAGVYPRTTDDIKKDRNSEERSGHYYRLMIEHVQHVLADIQRVCPEYDSDAGFEIAGFVWFQGWNDMVNRSVYPLQAASSERPRFALYSDLMSHFICDVREDLNAPSMPFVIGVMGVGGDEANQGTLEFRQAMAEPAQRNEFVGNVFAVQTAPFWAKELGKIDEKYGQVRQMAYYLRKQHKDHANRDGSMSAEDQKEYLKKYEAKLISETEVKLRQRGASNAGYHYLGCAKTFAQMGEAFAKTLIDARSN